MARKKRVLGAEFKAKVALAAVQEQKTVQQIATLVEVHAERPAPGKSERCRSEDQRRHRV